ncbi:MAG: AraC family transcriptional regulator [Clostridia bacterium]|nr:AraC family transcriptional regulator [Clostridia bacterium]
MEKYITVTNEDFSAITPVQFGYQSCKSLHAYGPAIRTYWLIHFVVSGFGNFEINNKKYRVSPGEMFVIPPWVETFYQADKENPWEYIWIGFNSKGDLPHNLNDIIHLPEAFGIFNSMKKCEGMSGGRSSFLSSKIWELFSLIKENGIFKTDYVQTAREIIHSEYMNPITIEGISERLNLDRTYFSVLFRKKTGISPKNYLLNFRMDMAKKLLSREDVSVSVAAYSVGYGDVFNFSKMFKKCYGVSPSEYAKQKRHPDF